MRESTKDPFITLQLVVFAILVAVLPLVISDYFVARDELAQAKAETTQVVGLGTR